MARSCREQPRDRRVPGWDGGSERRWGQGLAGQGGGDSRERRKRRSSAFPPS